MKPFIFIFGVPLLCLVLALLTGCGDTCGSFGSCIEIHEEPTCAELVTDECVDEVTAEFCPAPVLCPPVRVEEPAVDDSHCVLEGDLCWRGQYINGNWKYVRVECDIQPSDCDSYGDDVPRGHLPIECRGQAGTTCRTTCVDLPLGPECTTVCDDTYA